MEKQNKEPYMKSGTGDKIMRNKAKHMLVEGVSKDLQETAPEQLTGGDTGDHCCQQTNVHSKENRTHLNS